MIDLKNLTIKTAREKLDRKEFSAVELAQAYLNEITQKNTELNVYLEVFDDVLEQAKQADKKIASGEQTILTGIPIAIKDNILIKGRRVSSASKILENYLAPYNATVIEKLKAQSVVFLGRVNMDEFAMGGSTENSAFGVTKNPRDITRVAGGSSGGSAAAVAANLCLCALGSDTGGSIRQPSSFCGVVGLKPTYGSVSRHGLMAMASSLDVIGPITKNIEDAEILYNLIKGADEMDATSAIEGKEGEVKTIGVPRAFLKGCDAEILQSFEQAEADLKKAGYQIQDIELPNIDYSLAVYYILMPAEVSANMARFDGVKYGAHVDGKNGIDDYFVTRGNKIGREVKRRIILGTYVLSAGYYDAYYAKALKVRDLIKDDFNKAFAKVDVIILPNSPVPAYKIGEKSADPLQMYLADIFTISANLATIPAISVPIQEVEREGKRLPVGLQILGPRFSEQSLFAVGKNIEKKE